MAIRAVLFDWDLTLAKTFWFRTRLFKHFCDKTGLPFWKLMFGMRGLFGMTAFGIFRMQKQLSWRDGLKMYGEEFRNHAWMIRVHTDIIKRLQNKGYIVAVITNDLEEHVHWYLQQKGVHIQVFTTNRKALRHFKLKPNEAVYVGDHPHDIQFGKNAGTRTIGYANLLHGSRTLGREHPDVIVQSLDEIPSVLKKLR
jgi:phosphoglycolate phosphatase-like HAD superfamily hydrolase